VDWRLYGKTEGQASWRSIHMRTPFLIQIVASFLPFVLVLWACEHFCTVIVNCVYWDPQYCLVSLRALLPCHCKLCILGSPEILPGTACTLNFICFL
jgi:hypothetical protein